MESPKIKKVLAGNRVMLKLIYPEDRVLLIEKEYRDRYSVKLVTSGNAISAKFWYSKDELHTTLKKWGYYIDEGLLLDTLATL